MFNIFVLRFILASTYTVGKVSFAIVKPLFFVGSCMLLAGLTLLMWCWFRSSSWSIKKDDWWLFLQLAVYQIYLPYGIDFYAAQYVSSNKWALIHAACPFVTALLSWMLLQEALTIKKSIGLFVGISGLLLIFMQSSVDGIQQGSPLFVPEFVLTFSMIVYSYSWILVKRIASEYSPLFINGVIMTIGGTLALITSVFCEACLHVSPITSTTPFLVLLIFNTLVTIVGFPLYTYLLSHYSVTFIAFSSFLEPLFVTIFGWMLLSETISNYFVFAFGLLTLGLYIFHKAELPCNENETTTI